MPLNADVSMKDVARQAGVHASTVSLALRDSPRLKEETRRMIQREAARMGYRPNPVVAALAARRWNKQRPFKGEMLAYLTGEIAAIPVLLNVQKAAASEAERLGYGLEVFRIKDYPSARHLSRVLFSRGIRGVVLAHLLDMEWMKDFEWNRFSLMSCSLGNKYPPANVVIANVFAKAKFAWQNALACGYRRIGVVNPTRHPDELTALKMGALFFSQAMSNPHSHRIPICMDGRPENRSAYVRWHERYRPDVIIGYHDLVLDWIKDNGCRVPEDVGFISLHKETRNAGIAGTWLDQRILGQKTIQMLDAQLRANEYGLPKQQGTFLLMPQWIWGRTLPRGGLDGNWHEPGTRATD